ncbi:cell division protein [Qipengyuania sp. 1XM1-15A]|uniref:cell division protein FtsX n=1 Tax=Qipengyuania xiamenensis TaxID=2867237 RepID=UPI001C881D90|nr:cell division protein [Qipengyuania xiamenensis]MBX7532800.1 cell division protein [Qipengyuania xiamenensis]
MKRPPTIGSAVDRGLAPFRGRRAAHLLPKARFGGPIPWVIAVMVALTVLAAGGALALSNMVSSARGDLEGSATVQVIEPDADARQAKAAVVVDLLAQDPAVVGFRAVPESEVAELLEPWLGGGEGMEAVPLPALIDVELRDGTGTAELERIEAALQDAAPGSRIDSQAQFLAPVLSALRALQWMALAMIILLAFTGAAAVWLASRNVLGGNRDTIEIVHLLGGNDDQIARVFQRSILFDAIAGGLLGLVTGALAITLMARQFAALDSGMVAGGSLSALDWAILALVPLFAVGIAVYTARMTVIQSLRKML